MLDLGRVESSNRRQLNPGIVSEWDPPKCSFAFTLEIHHFQWTRLSILKSLQACLWILILYSFIPSKKTKWHVLYFVTWSLLKPWAMSSRCEGSSRISRGEKGHDFSWRVGKFVGYTLPLKMILLNISGQIIATNPPVGHPKWWFSKGIPPKSP